MYVISASDNLIETLRLIARSDAYRPLFSAAAAADDNTATAAAAAGTEVYEAYALLAHEIGARCCANERHWLVLVAKEWEPLILYAIADIARICLSQSAQHTTARIIVVKREPCAGDFELLRDHLSATREAWRLEWTNVYEKYSRLGESAARAEHLAKVERWAQPAQLDFQLVYMDDPDLLTKICDFAMIPADHEFTIVDAPKESDESPTCFTKPPALHWTNYPREADVQVSFKFSFPQGTITDALFRTWSATVRDFHTWEYTYKWTNGVFLRQQLVKMALVRGPTNIVEITGRIDKDEADEEDDEEREDENADQSRQLGNGSAVTNKRDAHWGQPLHRVWPYFAKAFECFLANVDAIESLPYTLNVVLIGELFFDSPDGARKVNSRSLDAVQTFGAIERAKAVRFKVQDDPEHVYSVRLSQAFAGFTPTRLADICTAFIGEPPPCVTTAVSTPQNTVQFRLRSDSADSLTDPSDETRNSHESGGIPPICASGNSLSTSPISSDRLNGSDSNFSAPLDRGRQSSNCRLSDRQLSAQRNRGRRVSFGAIRAIPPHDLCGNSASASTSPLLTQMSGGSHRWLLHSTNLPNRESDTVEGSQHLHSKTNKNLTLHNVSARDVDDEDQNGHVQTSDVIHDYVDRMLQNAIDEVFIDK